MAARRGKGAADGKLSVGAAHYYARIYSSARAGCLAELRRAGCGEQDAEDIFAATFERIMRKFDPPDPAYAPAQMVALLKKACRQKLIDERRHRDVLQMVPLEHASERCEEGAEGPAGAAEEREAVAMAREAISSLPERDRAIFFQRHHLNLTPEEIQRRNPGLSRRTYAKIMQRANARALERFEQIGSGRRCAQIGTEQLGRYASGEASEAERAIVRAHLRHCNACRLEAVQMRQRLHEIASGLAAVIGVQFGHTGLGGWMTRLSETGGRVVDGLGAAVQSARERLRELALRAATGFPGSGGDSAAGQLAGISAAKVASVCAAGALAAGCLVAGVAPGLSALDPPTRHHHRQSSPSRAVSPPSAASATTRSSVRVASGERAARSTAAGEGGKRSAREGATASPLHRASPTTNRPVISGRQTGADFGGEADGTGTFVPSVSVESPPGEESSAGGVQEDISGTSEESPPSRSRGSSEFGF